MDRMRACCTVLMVLFSVKTGRAGGHDNVHCYSPAFAAPQRYDTLRRTASLWRRGHGAAVPVAERLRTRRWASEPELRHDARVSSLITNDLEDLHARLMQAPWELGAHAPAQATAISMEKLRVEPGNLASARTAAQTALLLCEELCNNHFAIMRLDSASHATMDGMWLAARSFFDLPWQERLAAAGAHRRAAGNVGVIGWDIMPDDNEILEMRVSEGGGIVPDSIDAALPGAGFTAAMIASRTELFALAHLVLRAVEAYVGLPQGGLTNLIDDGTKLARGHVSSSQVQAYPKVLSVVLN